MAQLESLRTLVTGGTSGAGAGIVEGLRARGASVVFTGRDAVRAAEVERRTGASFVAADVRDANAVRRSVEESIAILGGLDAVVLSAALLHDAPLSETSDDAWDAVMETNLIGPYLYAVECMPALREASRGSIVAISCDVGDWPETALGAFSVSKRALTWLGQMLAIEDGEHGVRVNVVSPGVMTPQMASFVGGRRELPDRPSLLPPLGKTGTPDELAASVAFFLSPDSSFCNGSVLLVDGGMRASMRAWQVHNK